MARFSRRAINTWSIRVPYCVWLSITLPEEKVCLDVAVGRFCSREGQHCRADSTPAHKFLINTQPTNRLSQSDESAFACRHE